MKSFYFFLLLSAYNFCVAQDNASLYQGTSMIHIKSTDDGLLTNLESLGAINLSCRTHSQGSDFIVDIQTINWLINQDVEYTLKHEDVQAKIMAENALMEALRANKSNDGWYDVYRTYDEVMDKFDVLASQYEIASSINLGDSYEGRAIKGLKISSGGTNKPSVFINGCQHAREWITVMSTSYIAENLCANYASDDLMNSILDLVDVYIIPIVNPDGYVYSHTTDRYWRKNRQPNAGSCIGTDLNRNWDADWNGGQSTSTSSCSDIYVGTAPFSAIEANLLKTYMESIGNLEGHLDIHSYSALVLGPWGYTNSPSPDHEEIIELGTNMNTAISNTHNYNFTFGTGDANGSIYLASGTMPDWSYDGLGALGYTYELRPASASGGGFELAEDQIIEACEEAYNGVVEMLLWAADMQSGCTDANALNYNPEATIDNGSCTYPCTTSELQINIVADNYPSETTWQIMYENGEFIASGDVNGGVVCLSEACYTFSIYDSYGDGICCSYGEGSYTLLLDELEIATGGDFDSEESVYFCVEETISPNTETQIIELPQAWFIFSSYIQQEIPLFQNTLESIQEHVIIVKDNEGMSYLPDWDYNGIGNFDCSQGYLIKTSQATTLILFGDKIQPESYPISMDEGWNIISYLRDSPANMTEMLAQIQSSIIIAKDYAGAAFLPDWDYNGIGDMNPGEGYQIKMSSNSQLLYPQND